MNMSYCRFENTLADLRDCERNLDSLDEDDGDEIEARRELILTCARILEEIGVENLSDPIEVKMRTAVALEGADEETWAEDYFDSPRWQSI